jgi:hypothetical protein
MSCPPMFVPLRCTSASRSTRLTNNASIAIAGRQSSDWLGSSADVKPHRGARPLRKLLGLEVHQLLLRVLLEAHLPWSEGRFRQVLVRGAPRARYVMSKGARVWCAVLSLGSENYVICRLRLPPIESRHALRCEKRPLGSVGATTARTWTLCRLGVSYPLPKSATRGKLIEGGLRVAMGSKTHAQDPTPTRDPLGVPDGRRGAWLRQVSPEPTGDKGRIVCTYRG